MRKLTIELEVPDNVRDMFIKDGIKEEDVDDYIKKMISDPIQALLHKLFDLTMATKSKVLSPEEAVKKVALIIEDAQKTQDENYERKREKSASG